MHEPKLRSSLAGWRFLRLGAVVLLAGLGVAFACTTDDVKGDKPEPPPKEPDAGSLEGGGGGGGCPSTAPRVGEVCPRPDQLDETCHYELGTCTVDGGTEESRVADFRCNNGIWIRWGDPGPCDTP